MATAFGRIPYSSAVNHAALNVKTPTLVGNSVDGFSMKFGMGVLRSRRQLPVRNDERRWLTHRSR